MSLDGFGKTGEGVSRVQFPTVQFPSFREFGNPSSNSGTVVVDVLPQIYTQTDLVNHSRNKILESPDGRSERDSPVSEKAQKVDTLKGNN